MIMREIDRRVDTHGHTRVSGIAFTFSNAELQRVFVRSVDGKSSLGLAEFPLEKVRLRGFDWANSGRVILSADAPDPKEQGVQPR